MAERTVSGEAGLCMIWVRRRVVARLVARVAIGRSARILAIDVALGTRHCRVESGQSVMCIGGVIKVRIQPVGRRVAD